MNKKFYNFHNKCKKYCKYVTVTVGLFFVSAANYALSQDDSTAYNDELQVLKTQIDSLRNEKIVLENATVQKLNAEGILSKRLIEQFGYSGFVVASGNSKISIGGLIVGNAYQDFRSMSSENYFAISQIPTDAAAMFRTRFDVGNSRFYINSDVNTEKIAYKTRFEFDFFNGSGAYVFRLRHAFVEFGRFGVGYSSSNFTNLDVTPDIINNGGAPGEVGYRQTQFRYTHPLSSQARFVIAVEDGEGNFLRDNVESSTTRIGPDVVANFRYKPHYSDILQFQLAGVLHPLGYKQAANPFTGNFGWGISGWGAISLFEQDYASFQLAYSNGATKYIGDPVVTYDARVTVAADSSISIEPIKMLGAFFYYHRRWSEHYASNIGYSYVGSEKSQFSNDSQAISGHYASANIIYYPNSKMSFGLEPIFGLRQNLDGTTAFNVRMQFQVQFSF